MQILINIPEVYESESELNLIVKNGTVTYVSMGGSCHEEFECTVLPKGHGRLIDADWLKNAIHNFFYGLNRAVEEEDIQRYIDVARTRIEADKGDKE